MRAFCLAYSTGVTPKREAAERSSLVRVILPLPVGARLPWPPTGGGVKRYAAGGFLDGEDDGMADTVPATIEGQEPAALSHGEYVVPADVVAAMGDGNNKAGAKKMDGLIALLRQKKYGRNKQPPPVGLPSLLKRAKIV